jgi:hypothetical protein
MASELPPETETVHFFLDGSDYIAVRPGWQDEQTSPTGSGATRGEALESLLAQERRSRYPFAPATPTASDLS